MSGNSWGAKHKGMLAIAGAAAATALTMGAASPALAAALGGTAAAEGAGAAGGAAAGLGAVNAVGPGLGAGLAAGFGPGAAGGGALAADAAATSAIPSLTGGGAAGMGGGTSSLFGGTGLLGGSAPETMYTAGLGTGSGGISAPTFADKVGSFMSPEGGKYRWDTIKSGLGKVSKAQQAYKSASGLLGGQPQGGGAAAPGPNSFGSGAGGSNLSQYMNQPNPMMGQTQLTPQMLALLLKLQQGGMNG